MFLPIAARVLRCRNQRSFLEDNTMRKLTICGFAAAALLSAPVLAQAPQVTTVASYPHGTFLENLSVDPAGRLLFTSYLDKRLMAWTGDGAPTPLAVLDAHPVAVLARANDIVLSAHGLPFTGGPAFTATNQLLVQDRNGAVAKRVAAPDALFLNGMVEIDPATILVADSIAGKIWRFDPVRGAVAAWLSDPLLAADPAQPPGRPGANGLKTRDGWLYVSNSSRGTLHRIRLAGTAPTGSLELFATTGPIDDFAFLGDGSIVATTHSRKLVRVAADRTVADILSDGCDGCTSVASFGPRQDLIVLTTGNLLEGGNTPARVLRLASPVR
jgi:sugar lactone lactonase YvrE